VSLDTTPRIEIGALMAVPVTQAPSPTLDFSSIFVAKEEEHIREANQSTTNDLTLMHGINSPDLFAIDAFLLHLNNK
jgi:hypothetical protein